MTLGIAFIDSGPPYLHTRTGKLHSILMRHAQPPNKSYIAASLLMDAERDWYLRLGQMYKAQLIVEELIKGHLECHPPNIDQTKYSDGSPYEFCGIVREEIGAEAQMIFESEVASALNALYMVSERVQKLVKAMTAAGLGTFGPECNESSTGDGLNGITSRLFNACEKDNSDKSANLIATKEILRVRSEITHRTDLDARYELDQNYAMVDAMFYSLSTSGDGSRACNMRLSQFGKAQQGFKHFLAWFVNRIDSDLTFPPIST